MCLLKYALSIVLSVHIYYSQSLYYIIFFSIPHIWQLDKCVLYLMRRVMMNNTAKHELKYLFFCSIPNIASLLFRNVENDFNNTPLMLGNGNKNIIFTA